MTPNLLASVPFVTRTSSFAPSIRIGIHVVSVRASARSQAPSDIGGVERGRVAHCARQLSKPGAGLQRGKRRSGEQAAGTP
jgi:hypothetical protein